MDKFLEQACEEIDAALFSGDCLYRGPTLKTFELYLNRWCEKIAEVKKETDFVADPSAHKSRFVPLEKQHVNLGNGIEYDVYPAVFDIVKRILELNKEHR